MSFLSELIETVTVLTIFFGLCLNIQLLVVAIWNVEVEASTLLEPWPFTLEESFDHITLQWS